MGHVAPQVTSGAQLYILGAVLTFALVYIRRWPTYIRMPSIFSIVFFSRRGSFPPPSNPHSAHATSTGSTSNKSLPSFSVSSTSSVVDLSAKAPSSSSHIWLLFVAAVTTLLEGQRWPFSPPSSQRRIFRPHRLWTVPSASNHQRFMHPEERRRRRGGGGVPVPDLGGAGINEKREKRSWFKK